MILGISGSPRKDGGTANAVKKILEESGMESEYISLSGKKINGCISCLGCVEYNNTVNSNVLSAAKVFVESNKCNIIDEFTLDAVSQCYTCKEGHNCKVGKVVREHGVVDKITDEIRPKEFCNNRISISRTEEAIKKIKEYTKKSKNLKG